MTTAEGSRRGFLDRDVVRDNKGRIWVVLGHIQPADRVIAFLKYVPDKDGRWSKGQRRFRRVFWGGVQSVANGMDQMTAAFLFNDPHFRTLLPSIPIQYITKHFKPEVRLRQILELGPRDPLEESALTLAEILSDTAGIKSQFLGVAGSIAWHAHDPKHSDINMCVYGLENAWRLQESYEQLPDKDSRVSLRKSTDWRAAKSRVLSRVPRLDVEDIHSLFERRRALHLDNQCIGVTPVLLSYEAPIPYLNERYQDVSSKPVKATFDVRDATYGLFLPSLYIGESDELQCINGQKTSRLMIYEGAFRGLAQAGDRLEVAGTVQRVMKPSGKTALYQLMVGTKAGAGREYIRLL